VSGSQRHEVVTDMCSSGWVINLKTIVRSYRNEKSLDCFPKGFAKALGCCSEHGSLGCRGGSGFQNENLAALFWSGFGIA
jgi:hypothetical protein